MSEVLFIYKNIEGKEVPMVFRTYNAAIWYAVWNGIRKFWLAEII